MQVQNINISEFDYELATEKIANFPLIDRDASKLLIYKNEIITETIYKNIADQLSPESFIVFNNTKVIQARIIFEKNTGSTIEIFVLEPFNKNISEAMQTTQSLAVKCFIGGASKWKEGLVIQKELIINNHKIILEAKIIAKEIDFFIVELKWNTEISFIQILEVAGKIPLPPYIKRNPETLDESRYQTIYASFEGSVAAPTAGLHFTPYIMEQLLQKKISSNFITLHVGAGTFKPVTITIIKDHLMHQEFFEIRLQFLEILVQQQHPVIAVGTTSVRTLESLYWLGVKVFNNKNITLAQLKIEQWEVYILQKIDKQLALQSLINYMKQHKVENFFTTTQLLIAPSYLFQICNIIVTNFHQPKSTLLLLVAAATKGSWKKIYDYALINDFRFLSYGDGCIIFI